MKKLTIIIILFALLSCGNNFEKTYKGKIANKYDITLTLSSVDGRLEGFYFYQRKGQGLRIEGNIDSNGNLILQETVDGKRTGVINAKKIGDEINGVWKNPTTGKELDFSIKEANINYNEVFINANQEASKKQQEIEYKKLTGIFASKIDSRTKVKTEFLRNNQLLFEIDMASEKCAMNAYKGVANIINLNKSVFKKGDFELTFKFLGRDLNITSKGNDDNLGMYCYPTGTFTR